MAPLVGTKVVDFTHLLPGEYCSTALCELGASVIRVEPIHKTLNQMLPPLVDGQSLYYWSLHRNKSRIALNLKAPAGLDIALKLLADADVLLENYRPGVMERLGLGFETLRELNPRLIYCSISGYGQSGSWSAKPAHDLNLIAETGVLAANAKDGDKPILPSVLVSDYTSALYAALKISSHLYEREKSGSGARIDISMFESALSTMQIAGTSLLYAKQNAKTERYTYPKELPNYTTYECSDGRYLACASLEAPFWKIFCEKAGVQELANRVVTRHDVDAYEIIGKAIKKKTLKEWTEIFEGTNCCVSPVSTIEEALEHPPVVEHQVVHNMQHPEIEPVPQVTSPLSFGITESVAHTNYAEQSIAILSALNYTPEEIETLKADGVLV